MTQIACALCDKADRENVIGTAGETVDVYAFRGGAGIDSVFQLGVAHAHIVADLPAPSLLVGVSVGAVHATATAEVLTAPHHLPAAERARPAAAAEARLNRFREILFAYQDFMTNLPGALPDAFEADAGRPLVPHEQAIHFEEERAARQRALQARSGIVALINDIFRQTITIRTLTRAARAILGLQAMRELPRRERRIGTVREVWRLVKTIAAAPMQCLRLAVSVVHAYVGGTVRVARGHIEDWPHTRVKKVLDRFLRLIEGRHGEGYTAGDIIFTSGPARIAPRLVAFATLSFLAISVVATGAAIVAVHWPSLWWMFMPLALAVIVGSVLIGPQMNSLADELRQTSAVERILAYYDLKQDIGNEYLVEDLFIRLFDPAYYGHIDMADVARRAMEGSDAPHREEVPKTSERRGATTHEQRTFAKYARSPAATDVVPPIHVVPFVADLKSGVLQELPEKVPIVNGLLAAVSTVPFLRPAEDKVGGAVLVDAGNIADDAVSPAIDILRLRLHPNVRRVRVFSVSPITTREADNAKQCSNIIDTARVGLDLSRFRDAHVDAEVVDLYNHLIPRRSRRPERLPPNTERALCCFGNPPGDDDPMHALHFVRSTIAPIEPRVALHTSEQFLRAADKTERQKVIARAVAEGCRATLAARFGMAEHGCRVVLNRDDRVPPGAVEVCEHCDVYKAAVAGTAPQSRLEVEQPPAVAPNAPAISRPTVNLLFSGGVFRGVFQIGVLNALNELGARPDVIAGSSVGSIVAAMIAHVFTTTSTDAAATAAAKHRQIARLAATFMTLDHLIVTDRFADFVRRFTLRAAAAKFSLRDADLFFRNYDAEMKDFSDVARRVAGGIEHLFYIDPFKLSDLVRAFRRREYASAFALASGYAQDLCDRGLIGAEVLGAEPLSLLIKQHVMSAADRVRPPHAVSLDALRVNGLEFLLTATNLTTRSLVVIGGNSPKRAALLEALLASSAFPGAFRPRWSREIFFEDNSTEQYIDGGVLDNLPITPVVDYLYQAAKRGEIAFRPEGNKPHLVLTASLEPETVPLTDPRETKRLSRSWVVARKRAKRLRYNQKMERFAKVQRDLRFIWNQYASVPARPIGLDTLDIEVLIVKPKWLCGTFAFHPMLGFRRQRQAESIAHGCAATFATIARMKLDPNSDPTWLSAWGLDAADVLDGAATFTPDTHTDGRCHFRRDHPCPFSKEMLAGIPSADVDDRIKSRLEAIYTSCGQQTTHLR